MMKECNDRHALLIFFLLEKPQALLLNCLETLQLGSSQHCTKFLQRCFKKYDFDECACGLNTIDS